ncbi:MAG: glycoside hydrolase family 43 [Anaerocolumna sp.]|nr:glycoside hydrolase family 43 [Anaerocolumna sp.]
MIQNPILRGFTPDPSIIRVLDDYYIATSTFEWWPGVNIHHSKDLKHWEQIPSPLNRLSQLNMIGNPTSGGIWAPCLSYHEGTYYLVYTDVKTKKGRFYNNHNYLIETKDIYGEWSEPVYLNSTGFDPSLFHDSDGKKYLVNMRNGFKGILLQEYDAKNKCLIGEVKNIYAGTSAGYTEGPHLYHINEWYYLIVAEGGTGYGHCVTMARSKNIWGCYETDPKNPMLFSSGKEYLQKCGHADITDTGNGDWYMVHLCARPKEEKKSILGRETALQEVYWNNEGWLRLKSGRNSADDQLKEPEGIKEYIVQSVQAKDDFDEPSLRIDYKSPRIPLGENMSLSERKGYLRLYGQESLNSLHRVSLLALKQKEYKALVQTAMDYAPTVPEQVAGLSYMYDALHFYIFGKSADDQGREYLTLIKSDKGVIEDMILPLYLDSHIRIFLRIKTDLDGNNIYFSYSYDEKEWIVLPLTASTDILCDEYCLGFTGAHFGLYCHDMTGQRLFADFDYFISI